MKTLIIIIFTLLSFGKTLAGEITLINNGKPGGSSDARTKIYHEGLKKLGYQVNYENIGQITQSVEFFMNYDKPVLMTYVNIFAGKQEVLHTMDNFVLLEYLQPLYICSTKQMATLPENITVAYGKSYNPKMIFRIFEAMGKNATLVPYKNSGAVLEAILGGDVDVAFNNQGKSLKYLKSGKGSCHGHTGDVVSIGVEPLKAQYNIDFELPIMIASVIAKNVDLDSLRKDLIEIINGKDFVDYHQKKKLITYTTSRIDEYKITKESELLWK